MTYFPVVVKNGAIVIFFDILRWKKGDCQQGESETDERSQNIVNCASGVYCWLVSLV